MDGKNDHYYAEMLNIMRSQGSKDNPTTLQLGVMLSSNSVKIDDLVLNAEDLYIADYLVTGYSRTIKEPYVSAVSLEEQTGKYSANTTKQSSLAYKDGLKKGDLVAIQKLDNTSMYVILARVVQAK